MSAIVSVGGVTRNNRRLFVFGLFPKFLFLLLLTAAVGICAAVVVRDRLVSDFAKFREGEMEDRVYWVSSEAEQAYHRGVWDPALLRELLVRALVSGLDSRIVAPDGMPIMERAAAVASLPPARQQLILSLLRSRLPNDTNGYVSYPLFAEGNEIGQLDVRFIEDEREQLFINRSNRMLLFSALGAGLVAALLGLFVARHLTRPLQQLTESATALARGDEGVRVPVSGSDEVAMVSSAFNRMAESLERQESLRKKLFSNAAHELRTPLAAMRCELEGMIDGLLPLNQEQVRSLLEEAERLTRLVRGMEELMQAESSQVSLHPQPVQLASFLKAVTERFQPLADAKGIALISPDDDGITVSADPDRLAQIVVNLLSNALKATDAGGSIRLAVTRESETVLLTIEDTGCGISPEDLPHLFERFYHGAEGGLGIGLAIVHELAQAHGWSVSAASRQGEGSAFTITIPAGG